MVAAEPTVLDQPEDKALDVFRQEGVALMLASIRRSLADFGVEFDVYFSERTLHDNGEIELAVTRLREQGHVYEADGAVWLRTTDFGDDKDRVVVRSDGRPTYFNADCAYYLDKRERGADRAIFLLGADHHGYVGRLRAIAACFGDDPDETVEVIIGQLVTLGGGRMSRRAGNLVLLDEVGARGVVVQVRLIPAVLAKEGGGVGVEVRPVGLEQDVGRQRHRAGLRRLDAELGVVGAGHPDVQVHDPRCQVDDAGAAP